MFCGRNLFIDYVGINKILVENVSDFLEQTFVLPVLDPHTKFRVDFVFSVTEFERKAIARSRIVQIEGVPVRYISLEDLIIMKVLAGRPRDLEDVKSVLLKNPDYDRSMVKNHLQAFDSELNGGLCQVFEDIQRQVG